MRRNVIGIVGLVFISSVVFGQITITKTDFTSLFQIGTKFTSYGDTLEQSVNIGNTGGGNNWDFSSYLPTDTLVINYISPSGTPYESQFPNSTVTGYYEFESQNGTDINSVKSWTYYNSDDASILGSAFFSIVIQGGSSDSSLSLEKHDPPFVQYDFPLESGKIWSVKDSVITTIISQSDTFSSAKVSIYDYHVDAWGKMTLPSGKTVDALRLREKVTSTQYFGGIAFPPSISVNYFFLAKSGESFSINTQSENPPTSGNISGTIGWHDDTPTGIYDSETLPGAFTLKQNYPNPFNPGTTIQYSIPPSQQKNFILVRLKVYDSLGKEVAVLVNKNQTSGDYRVKFNADNLPSGIYFLSLQAGNFNKTIKMTLLK